jgi:hypothetical protein
MWKFLRRDYIVACGSSKLPDHESGLSQTEPRLDRVFRALGRTLLTIYAQQAKLSNMFIHRAGSDGGPQMITNGKYIHLPLGKTPLEKWIGQYEQSHQHPLNRILHTFGIPMIAISLPLLLLAPLIRGFWKVALSLFTIGWILQFVGHAIEGKPPEFFNDWRFLFIGAHWWLNKIQGRV